MKRKILLIGVLCILAFLMPGCSQSDSSDVSDGAYEEVAETVTMDDGTEVEVGTIFVTDPDDGSTFESSMDEFWDMYYNESAYAAEDIYDGKMILGYGKVESIAEAIEGFGDYRIYTEDGVLITGNFEYESDEEFIAKIRIGDIIEYEGSIDVDNIENGSYISDEYVGYLRICYPTSINAFGREINVKQKSEIICKRNLIFQKALNHNSRSLFCDTCNPKKGQ